MKVLRFLAIRLPLFIGLAVMLFLPLPAEAGKTRKPAAKTVAHKAKAHKSSGKTVKKATHKKASKSVTKKPAKQTVANADKPAAISGRYVSVAKDGVILLAGPSNDAEERWEIFEKFPLQVKKHQGAWLEVTDFEGSTGWIQDALVTGEKTVIVCKKRINLQQDPNNDSNNPLIATAKYGVVLTPLEKNGDWLKVRYDANTEGWLNKNQVWPSDPLD